MSRCQAVDCITPVKSEMLMCRKHWFMVPSDIRSRVWQAWLDVGRGEAGAWEKHDKVKKLAIEAVKQQESKSEW